MPDGSSTAHLYVPKVVTTFLEGYSLDSLRRDAVAGLTVGFPCTLAASRLLGHMLFGVSANDPITLIAVAFPLIAVAVIAGFVPLRRAMRVDPMVALRYE